MFYAKGMIYPLVKSVLGRAASPVFPHVMALIV